uniref:UDP-glucuronosyltransferase n=1 Tax=Strigamia maritima TaxID=126957 RepID=A0A023R8I6_STRMM|nr:UDP-glycosyltransferase 211A1 [Strigamia maritima]
MKLDTHLGLTLVFLFSTQLSEAYKILYLSPLASQSHKNVFDPVISELGTKGHEVTVVSPYKLAQPVTNVKEIIVDVPMNPEILKLMSEVMKHTDNHPLRSTFIFKPFTLAACEAYFGNPQVKLLLKAGQQFDIVIVNAFLNECALATAPLLGQYVIMHSPATLFPWTPVFVPQPPSYVPNIFLPYTSKMNFFQRLNNVLTNIGYDLMYNYHLVPAVQATVASHVAGNPSVHQAHKQVSFTLTNADPVLISARPSMPNVVDVGGLHCRKAKPLPTDLEDFVQKSGNDGFIYFSLGSNAQIKHLGKETKAHLLNAFSKLKQKVIFKSEEDLKDLPSNVKLVKWAPQQDLLGHPKIRAFITHGGLLSLQESVYHEVPVVAVPLFGDQPSNVARVEELEIGAKLAFNDISSDTLLAAVNKVLSKSYKENMKKYSAVFRDHLQHPLQRAVFWIEYVARHEGAKHLRSPGEDLNFFQYFLLDVIALILVAALAVFWVLFTVGKYAKRKFSPCKVKKSEKQEKKQQ